MSILSPIKNMLPNKTKRYISMAIRTVSAVRDLYGRTPRECNCCGYKGTFLAYGTPLRYDAECPQCSSLERHRLQFRAFDLLHPIKSGDRVVHFAPEAIIADKIKSYGAEYCSADIVPGRADLVLNIENLELPDASVDVVVANHILEHVDDNIALKEIFRVLSHGGRFLASIPIVEGWERTYENPDIVSPADRTLHFGQYDHIRYYGRDIRDRIRDAGFSFREYVSQGDECARYAFIRGDSFFVATKP